MKDEQPGKALAGDTRHKENKGRPAPPNYKGEERTERRDDAHDKGPHATAPHRKGVSSRHS